MFSNYTGANALMVWPGSNLHELLVNKWYDSDSIRENLRFHRILILPVIPAHSNRAQHVSLCLPSIPWQQSDREDSQHNQQFWRILTCYDETRMGLPHLPQHRRRQDGLPSFAIRTPVKRGHMQEQD